MRHSLNSPCAKALTHGALFVPHNRQSKALKLVLCFQDKPVLFYLAVVFIAILDKFEDKIFRRQRLDAL